MVVLDRRLTVTGVTIFTVNGYSSQASVAFLLSIDLTVLAIVTSKHGA